MIKEKKSGRPLFHTAKLKKHRKLELSDLSLVMIMNNSLYRMLMYPGEQANERVHRWFHLFFKECGFVGFQMCLIITAILVIGWNDQRWAQYKCDPELWEKVRSKYSPKLIAEESVSSLTDLLSPPWTRRPPDQKVEVHRESRFCGRCRL